MIKDSWQVLSKLNSTVLSRETETRVRPLPARQSPEVHVHLHVYTRKKMRRAEIVHPHLNVSGLHLGGND